MLLTVLYESPFWVGIFEREDEAGYSICRVVFGSEPSDAEVYEFCLENYPKLEFTNPIKDAAGKLGDRPRTNPKRLQREARRTMEQVGISSKAEEAMRLALEEKKKVRKEVSKQEREEEERRRFEQKQEKKKLKKRGH